MLSELKSNIGYKKIIILLAVASVAFSVCASLLSDICLPFAAAFVGLLLLFDKSAYKWVSILVFIISSIASAAISFHNLVFSVTVGLCALLLCIGYKKGMSKAELSVYLTVIYALCTVFTVYLIGANAVGTFDVSTVISYYRDMVNSLCDEFILQMKPAFEQNPELGIDEGEFVEALRALFMQMANLFLALIVVIAFFYAGVQIKFFTLFAYRLEQDPRPRKSWHFALSNVFAYFYIVLVIVSAFLGASEGVVGIAAMNLYYIFMFVFAYIGINYAFFFASRAKRKHMARLVLVVFLVMMNVMALQILSFVGVFVTTMHNKFLKFKQSGNDNTPMDE